MRRLRTRVTLIFEIGENKVIDEDLAKILLLIEKTGSILSASKTLGLTYSRVWEAIARAERILRVKLIEPRRGGRGGGGAKLTARGEKLLQRYVEEYRRILHRRLTVEKRGTEAPELVYAGSNDVLLERIFGLLREMEVETIEAAWIGSSGGLASLMLGEADLAGIHLYDDARDEYNTPFLERYWLKNRVILVRGYERELGFASRKPIEDPIEELVEGKARLVNRNLGSGTRVYLDHLLRKKAEEMGEKFGHLIKKIDGYENEVKTHFEAAKAVAENKADMGLTIRLAAEKYGLNFKPVKWEKFDFAIPVEAAEKKPIKAFLKILKSKKFTEISGRLPGYRVSQETGEVIYSPG